MKLQNRNDLLFEYIEDLVGVENGTIVSDRRSKYESLARQVACYVLRERGNSWNEIGAQVGISHSACIYAVARVTKAKNFTKRKHNSTHYGTLEPHLPKLLKRALAYDKKLLKEFHGN